MGSKSRTAAKVESPGFAARHELPVFGTVGMHVLGDNATGRQSPSSEEGAIPGTTVDVSAKPPSVTQLPGAVALAATGASSPGMVAALDRRGEAPGGMGWPGPL